ncbi:addiction module toxin RelE [Candidatus Woesearchaeota archaeon]|nr:MAG: addiction module toxin RelE [Candidatus Woesearchaeota archaeon]
MREFEIKPRLKKILVKLFKKDKARYEAVMKKIEEVINSRDIEHYKNLRYDMKDSKRVHVGHFVLVFSYDKANDFLSFEDYDHHDNIYK